MEEKAGSICAHKGGVARPEWREAYNLCRYHVFARQAVWTNVHRLVAPCRDVAFAWSETDTVAIDEESISRVSGNLYQHWLFGFSIEVEALSEIVEFCLFVKLVVILKPNPLSACNPVRRFQGHIGCFLEH